MTKYVQKVGIEINIDKLPEENDSQYLWRIGQAKDLGLIDLKWETLTSVINQNLRPDEDPLGESTYRKRYAIAKQFYDEVFSKGQDGDYSSSALEQKRELERAKIAFRDERNAWQKQNFADARAIETLNLLEEYIKKEYHNNSTFQNDFEITDHGIVICLSDWHIGADFHSFNGSYNSTIAQDRVNQLLEKILGISHIHNAKSCVVALCGDIISGNIHTSISITNRENVIQQIVLASQILTDFLISLSHNFHDVYVCGVSGNHSRITKKDDALKDERLDFIPLWYCKAALSNYNNVTVNLEENDFTIAEFNFYNKNYVIVHGDYDSFSQNDVAKFSLWLGYKPDVMIFAHKHYPAMSECGGVVMIQSGSLGGSGDDLTQQRRLKGKASQTVIVCSKDEIDCVYPVKFK